MDISLAVIRAPPQRRRVWHFTQPDWQGLKAAIKLVDWSPIATFSNFTSSWEFFQRNLLSLIHRFIPSRLQLSYPSSRPWFTEACGEAVVLKQLAFVSWKANPTEGNLSSFHKARNKCVSTLRRARKQHLSHLKSELSILSPSSKSWWHLIKSVSGVSSPTIPSHTSNSRTADTAREKAECLNSVFASKYCVQNPSLSVPTLPSHTQLSLDSVSFSPDKVNSLLSNLDSDSATGPDGISPRVLKICSAALAHPLSLSLCSIHPLSSIHPLIYSRSSAICLEISKHYRPA